MRNRRRTLLVLAALGLVVGAGGFVVAKLFFLPESATRVDEEPPDGDARAIQTGAFSGRAGHHVSGTATIIRSGSDHYLRFESYEQTQGPDVFIYVTPSPDPDSDAEVRAGLRVLIDGGADGGESTKVGTFHQRLPQDFDPTLYHGVAVWCGRFNVPFGLATLAPP